MQLWLNYTNENGDARRVLVKTFQFSIGRHSENDLYIPNNQLSRRHAEIDRYEDVFILADNNSSNGTMLNGKPLERPTALKNGDKINLGGDGGILLTAELASAAPSVQSAPQTEISPADAVQEKAAAAAEAEAVEQAKIGAEVSVKDFVPAIAQPAPTEKSSLGLFLILAPVLGLFVLLIAGGILFLVVSPGKDVSQNSDKGFIYSNDGDDEEKPNKNRKSNDKEETPTPSPKNVDNKSSGNSTPTPDSNNSSPSPAPTISSENDTVEKNALAFLRRIAKTDPNPVLTQKQIDAVNAVVKSFKGSSALRDNLQSLRKNASQVDALAKSKNLRPQFLAAAALAKIGNTRGDPLAAAQTMAGDLNQLSNLIGSDLSDDSLMIIAAYLDGGAASKMPSMIANLTKSSPAETRQIRTIWFLHDKGKISGAQYQFALRFLAIGAITQNPKDFNVESEAVVFN